MDIYDIIYVIRSVVEIVLFITAIFALKTYMRRLL
tara:strand:- start:254 stop:358 length:105 start_codon:yes stop_codon:yes gene_type:complete